MKKIISICILSMLILSGCGTTQPEVSGELSDETLSKNTVGFGFITFQDVQNNYGYGYPSNNNKRITK